MPGLLILPTAHRQLTSPLREDDSQAIRTPGIFYYRSIVISAERRDKTYFVTAWHDDHAIEVVASSSSLNLVGDEVSRLERVHHAAGAIANTIADSNGSKLVPNKVCFYERVFDASTEVKEVTVASVFA